MKPWEIIIDFSEQIKEAQNESLASGCGCEKCSCENCKEDNCECVCCKKED